MCPVEKSPLILDTSWIAEEPHGYSRRKFPIRGKRSGDADADADVGASVSYI